MYGDIVETRAIGVGSVNPRSRGGRRAVVITLIHGRVDDRGDMVGMNALVVIQVLGSVEIAIVAWKNGLLQPIAGRLHNTIPLRQGLLAQLLESHHVKKKCSLMLLVL